MDFRCYLCVQPSQQSSWNCQVLFKTFLSQLNSSCTLYRPLSWLLKMSKIYLYLCMNVCICVCAESRSRQQMSLVLWGTVVGHLKWVLETEHGSSGKKVGLLTRDISTAPFYLNIIKQRKNKLKRWDYIQTR